MSNLDFVRCSTCGGWTRVDLAGTPSRCSCCAKLIEHQAVRLADPIRPCPLLAGSPIIGRSIYKSGSLPRAEQAAAAPDAGQIDSAHPI